MINWGGSVATLWDDSLEGIAEICPRCGGELEEIYDEEGRLVELYCPDCGYKEIL
jgi:predicted RNA-binding Zn-ribbon protein involved in translation (DUF1610 family)